MKIQTINLSKTYFLYKKPIPVLENVNLTLQGGEFTMLTGASGVGKSTLLQLLGTLDVPSQGQILFDGQDIFAKSSAELSFFRNKNIGFVFQFHHLLNEFTAVENVMLPLLVQHCKWHVAQKSAMEWLNRVGLAARSAHKPGELSGGEQQRVALARALVTKPQILIADEPTGNLDTKTGEDVMLLMKNMCQQQSVCTIMATHNHALLALADRHLQMPFTNLSTLC